MKKIISMVLIAMLVLSFAAVGSAATLTPEMVDAADQIFVMSSEESEDIIVNATAENGVITVTYDSSVLAAATDAQATIIIFDASNPENATPSAGNMIQIDQFEFDPANTTYTYEYEAAADQIIVVMMGGTDIDKPGSATIEVGPGFVLGDVTGDSLVTLQDAVAVMQYSVNGTVDGEAASEDFLLAADYSDDGKVTMLDAIMIAYSIL